MQQLDDQFQFNVSNVDDESQSSASQISQTTTADEAPDVETAA